jgi:hypothetical protein
MKAAYIDRGAPKSYKPRSPTIRRFAGPECGGGAVDVAAASVNGANWRVRAGQYGQATFRWCWASVACLLAASSSRSRRTRASRHSVALAKY